MGSLSKIIFLECQKQLPSFHSITSADGDQLTDQQLSPRCWCSAYTKTISDIPVWNHTPASKGKESLTICEQQQKIISSSNPWIMNRCSQNIHLVCYYSSLLSFCSFTYYTWSATAAESPLALQLCCAQTFPWSRHKSSLPTHGSSSDTTSLCREGLLGTVESSQIHSLQHKTYFLNLPFSQGRSCPNPSSDYQLSCSSLSCPLQDANCSLPLGSNENNECVHTFCAENINKSG